ncbi:hypothetical protein LCGC14_2996590 [marine sediment metagenome]|uniref:Uncharacterized protein n=1 Tax=marine sediment metagenome TaxID=412755 RepID=A0A0F8XPU8_9ZZZZ
MSILNNPIRKTLTPDTGSASDTFTTHGLCHQILVKPTTASTQYDISLTDSGSVVVFKRTSEVGTMNEFITLPLVGAYTVAINNATVDEDHTVLIVVRNS